MANDNKYMKDLSEEDIKKLAKGVSFSEWFNQKMAEAPVARQLIQTLLQEWIDTIHNELNSRGCGDSVFSIKVQSKVGPIPGRGLILVVNAEECKGITVGDKVMPETEDVIYKVVGIEMGGSGGQLIGLRVTA